MAKACTTIAALAATSLVALAAGGCGATPERTSRDRAASSHQAEYTPAQADTASAPGISPTAEQEAAAAEERRQQQAARRVEAARTVIRDYYTAIGQRHFDHAWARLSDSLRNQFGGYATWTAGYETMVSTVSTSTNGQALNPSATRVDVHANVRSVDVDACDTRRAQRFAGTWTLALVNGRWRATNVSMRKTAGDVVRTSADQCPSAPPAPDYNSDDGGTDDYSVPVTPPSTDPGTPDSYNPYTDPDYLNHDGTYDGAPTTEDFGSGSGSIGQCADGTYSDSIGRPGACSWHGGVG